MGVGIAMCFCVVEGFRLAMWLVKLHVKPSMTRQGVQVFQGKEQKRKKKECWHDGHRGEYEPILLIQLSVIHEFKCCNLVTSGFWTPFKTS